MSKSKKYGYLAVSIAIAWGAAGLSYLLTGRDAMESYAQLRQPALAPPGWVFPIAWGILYTLMGVSAWLVWKKPGKTHGLLSLYLLQLALNVLWTPVFFRLGLFWAAFGLLCVLWAAILWMIFRFREKSGLAAVLQIPYLLWVAFAGYLNFMIAWLN